MLYYLCIIFPEGIGMDREKNNAFWPFMPAKSGIGEQEYKRARRVARIRRKKAPAAAVDRFCPALSEGLSCTQVRERLAQGLLNDSAHKFSKSYASIFVGNICTFFNLLCVLAALALAYSDASLSQYLFVVIFGLNLTFGIVTEVFAKRKMDRLSILTSPTCTVVREGKEQTIPARNIVTDDVVILTLGNQVPADCILAEGELEVNESLLTGESVPVKKQAGDTLYAGSFIAAGTGKVRADKVGSDTYLYSLSAKAKKYKKPHSELMHSTAVIIRIIGILIIPIAACMFYLNWNNYVETESISQLNDTIQRTVSIVIGMIPSGMLLLTSLALTLGIIRLMSRNTLVQDMYSLEMLARVNVLCLDKTGTLTDGRMKVNDCMVLNNQTGYTINELVGSCLHSLQDNNQTSIALHNYFGHSAALRPAVTLPFSSVRKLSAVTFHDLGTIAIGAPEFVLDCLPDKLSRTVNQYASSGLRVLLVAFSPDPIRDEKLPADMKPLALISLSDNIREEAADTIRWFKENDVAVKIISGDNPVTVSEVARRVGVTDADQYISLEGLNDKEVVSVANKYTVFGRVSPEQKAILIKAIKSFGNTVAMTGDGVNDILAMKEADCAVSVASGSDAAKNVSHIVLMDNNFASMPNVVFEGRRVINNIQNSSSMYLMKTLFTTFFAVITILANLFNLGIFGLAYPFKTNNLILMEVFVIGIATFFLSLQPNKNPVKGKFLPYVLSRAIPCAIVLVLAVQSTNIINYLFPGNFGTGAESRVDEISVVIITFAGLVMLYRVCLPLNLYRSILLAGVFACCVLCLTLFPQLVYGPNYQQLDFVSTLYVLVVILLCFPLSEFATKTYDKWQAGKKRNGPFEQLERRFSGRQ